MQELWVKITADAIFNTVLKLYSVL